jgi:hypothetical protein
MCFLATEIDLRYEIKFIRLKWAYLLEKLLLLGIIQVIK